MSYSYERVERRRAGGYGASGTRSTFGYWVPLVMTVTVATIGLATWIWSERTDDEEESSGEESYSGGIPPPGYASMSGGLPPGPMPGGFQDGPPPPGPIPGGYQGVPPPPGPYGAGPPPQFSGPPGSEAQYARSTSLEVQEDSTLFGRVSGAFMRAPSPQQSYDWASKKVVAGMAAAGAMVGGALSSIREDSQDDYEDHTRWSEEADNRDQQKDPRQGIKRRGTAHEFFEGQVEMPASASFSTKKRKTVAIVVDAVEHHQGVAEVGQHASILSHLPHHVDHTSTRVFVLIYSPDLRQHPLSTTVPPRAPGSIASSFSNIAHEDAHTPGEFPQSGELSGSLSNLDPKPIDDTTALFKTLYNQSQALVENDTMIMPFTTSAGYLHILRSLAPETVYIQESLCGHDGDLVSQLSGWVKQTVVVVGDEGGLGGLIDSEDEVALGKEKKSGQKWWQLEERTGLGRSVAVAESLRVGEDWRRRVGEHD